MSEPASGIVLAGGQSRRLGRDKRALVVGSARTQLEEVVTRLAAVTEDVVVVAGADPRSVATLLRDPPPHASVIPDAPSGVGPLGGLCAGLEAALHDTALVVACDLPFMSVAVLRDLLDRPRDYDLLVPRRADGRLEVLHAVYRRSCLPVLRARLERGRLDLHGAVPDLEAAGYAVRFVDDAEIARLDPRLRTFFNVNTPADLREAERFRSG